MDVKKVALLVGALVIAVVTAFMAKNMFAGASAPQAQAAPAVPMGPKVLVAKKALPVGTMIDADSLVYQAWPQELVQGAYYTEGAPDGDPAKMIGQVVRNAITAGQPVTRGALVGPNDRGFLAAALTPGMRAMTVPVSNTSGVGGFLFPGDRVDMMLTQQVDGDGPPLKVSETILRNVRILAIDQTTSAPTDEKGNMQPKQAGTVTIEVTPKIAEKILVAQTMGSISLVLRSIADDNSELERAVAAGDVKVPANASPADERKIMLAVASRPTDGATSFTTGGEVSRFQRKTVPARAPAAGESIDPISRLAMAVAGKNGAPASSGGAASALAPSGPTVRIARGNNVSIVPVGAR